MVEKSDQNNIFADQFPDEVRPQPHFWKWGVFTFLVVFLLGLLFINSFLQRKAFISQIKKQISYSIEALNQFGWDLAYDNVSFNAFPLSPLGEIENLKIYNRQKNVSWNAEKISFDNSILNTHKLNFEISGQQFVSFHSAAHKISVAQQEMFIEVDDHAEIALFSAKFFNISIADCADIEKFVVLSQKLPFPKDKTDAPSFEVKTEISDIVLNGLLDYPLAQNIRKIYFSGAVIGKVNFDENFRSALQEWLAKGGSFEINDFNISWPPLLLVGKGNLYLNEKFKPILQLNTTSKGLAVLIDELEQKNWLDSKSVFVAKILLSEKSYKQNAQDEHLTVTTPISLRDDALLIEKIAVKKFD